MTLPSYVIISPVRDEVTHFKRTAESLLSQIHAPAQWIIVDDGSNDGTERIIDELAEQHAVITVVRRPRRTTRARGAPIVEAFNAGLEVMHESPEFIVKLDGDLYLPPHYFAWVATTFATVEDAGIVGGIVHVHDGASWNPDRVARQSVHGAIKAYRLRCFDEIGGLHASMGWDGIDEYAARARGWRVYPLTELQVLHYAPRGSKQRWLHARLEEGRGAWFMGYRPSFVLVRAGYRMLVESPPVLGGLALALGYLRAALLRQPTVPDDLARSALRREQRQRLTGLLRLNLGMFNPPGEVPPGGGPAFDQSPDQPQTQGAK
jgi:glycosyltransferase involved in cell wall biosynthesis